MASPRASSRLGLWSLLCVASFPFLLGNAGCLAAISRSGFNDPLDTRLMSERSFGNDDMHWLKASTTVFFLRPDDMPNRAAYEAAIKSVWTFTPIEVVSIQDRPKYGDRLKYSYFYVSGEDRDVYIVDEDRHTSHLLMTHSRAYLVLMKASDRSNPMDFATVFSRSELMRDHTHHDAVDPGPINSGDGAYYVTSYYRNWGPAQIALYLESVQRDLETAHRRWLFDELENKPELARLKSATLLVPDYVLVDYNSWTGDESKRHDPKQLFKDYPYPIKIVGASELDAAVANAGSPVFVLDYVRSSSDKFVTVFERGKGMIYRRYSSSSYNLDDGDLGSLKDQVQ